MHLSNENEESSLDINDTPPFSVQRTSFAGENEVDDVYAAYDDNEEGILEDKQMTT